MAAYDTLRAAIDSYIKANGNKEITGTVLNDILNAMVSALGADTRFAGVAVPSTNPGNPEGNVVYFASQAGTYSNFGGIVLPLGIHILVWNGTAWTSQTWFSVDNTPTQNSQNLATSGGILQAIVDAVGVERLRAIGVEVTSCSFDSNTKKISFFNSANTTLFQLDATAFVIDGMVSDVKIEDGNLVIQFNTDAGKQDIEIPLTDIFNPDNYYTKTAIDALLALYYTKTETDALLTAINNKLAEGCLYRGMAEPTTNPPTPTTKVFYIATKAGTYTNFGNLAVTEGIAILKYDGSNWSKEQISYSDGVFDISAYNGTSYADLSAALGTNGANIPQNLRKGGMSVKFVLSSDNKYVQARCMAQNFTTDVTQWQGVDDEPTAGSKNLVESGGVEKQVSPLKETLRTDKQLDSFNITDLEGNVVAKINSNGIQAVEFLIKNGTTLTELLNGKVNIVEGKGLSDENYTSAEKGKLSDLPTLLQLIDLFAAKADKTDVDKIKAVFYSDYNDAFYIADADGYIILKATANGVEYVKPSGGEIDTSDIKNNAVTEPKIKDGAVTQAKTNLLKGYTLYSIGDSLSVWGYWQERIAAVTGCTFDNSKNIDANYPISISGKSSYGLTFENLLWQAKNLISQNVITNQGENTIIVLENGNDANQTQTFDKSARTYIPGNVVDAGLLVDFSNTVLQNIPSAQRTLNTVLKVLAVRDGTNLKITTLPTREGDVSIYTQNSTGHSTHFIHVIPQATPQATMEYVLDKILEYSYLGIEDTLGADGESVNFANQLSDNVGPNVVFEDVDNTGMEVTISHTDDARKSYAMYFKGTSIEDAQWAVTSNWQQGITFSEGIKSGLQLLKTTYPKAKIFMTMFPLFNAVQSDFLNANGTYDHNAFYNTDYDTKCRALLEAYKEVATFYNIPLINVRETCNINLDNMNEYYYNNNPHPKNRNCYSPIADVIAKQLITYLV